MSFQIVTSIKLIWRGEADQLADFLAKFQDTVGQFWTLDQLEFSPTDQFWLSSVNNSKFSWSDYYNSLEKAIRLVANYPARFLEGEIVWENSTKSSQIIKGRFVYEPECLKWRGNDFLDDIALGINYHSVLALIIEHKSLDNRQLGCILALTNTVENRLARHFEAEIYQVKKSLQPFMIKQVTNYLIEEFQCPTGSNEQLQPTKWAQSWVSLKCSTGKKQLIRKIVKYIEAIMYFLNEGENSESQMVINIRDLGPFYYNK